MVEFQRWSFQSTYISTSTSNVRTTNAKLAWEWNRLPLFVFFLIFNWNLRFGWVRYANKICVSFVTLDLILKCNCRGTTTFYVTFMTSTAHCGESYVKILSSALIDSSTLIASTHINDRPRAHCYPKSFFFAFYSIVQIRLFSLSIDAIDDAQFVSNA